jgi:hypothetical protein
MSSDRQFTALGQINAQTVAGFQTTGTKITYGVNAQGLDIPTKEGCGVYGESLDPSPDIRRAQANSRSGVWGVGDHYGIYGASGQLYDHATKTDETPTFSPDLNVTGNTAPRPIGVVGASADMPGVIGSSGLTAGDTESGDANGIPLGWVCQIAANAVGVMGLTNGKTFGAAGLNVNVQDTTILPNDAPEQILSVLRGDDPANPLDRFGLNGGVLGWSINGRGGVFGSALPVVGAQVPQNALNQAQAQLRLLPAPVMRNPNQKQFDQPTQPPLPSLPLYGQAGDMIAVITDPVDGRPQQAQLWFCIESGSGTGDAQEPATWAEVSFTRTSPGTYQPFGI